MEAKRIFLFLFIALFLVVSFFYLSKYIRVLWRATGAYEFVVTSGIDNIEPNEKRRTLTFVVQDPKGRRVTDFKEIHTKPLHLIIVKKDLSEFQHLHPTHDIVDMSFFTNITFPTRGSYRLFADSVPGKESGNETLSQVVVWKDIEVSGEEGNEMMLLQSDGVMEKELGGYHVALSLPERVVAGEETPLSLTVQKEGRPVANLEEYLGALGHAVIIRSESLDYIHTHPEEHQSEYVHGMADTAGPTVLFSTRFPKSGVYKLFFEFQHGGVVRMADFIVVVDEPVALVSDEASLHVHH